MPEERRKIEPPQPSAGDHAQAVARAGVSAIPFVGGAAAELYHHLIGSPLERRQQQWMEDVSDALGGLSDQVDGLSLEGLAENEAFISAAMRASQIAIRTHQAEKREALRNAVLNIAAGTTVDEDQQAVFIDAIDTLTPWHLRVLRFLADPPAVFDATGKPRPNISMGSTSRILEEAYPELKTRGEFISQVVRDLHSRGWIGVDGITTMMSESGLWAKRTKATGDAFLEFVSDPRAGARH